MGDKGDKSAARPPEGSLVETSCLIKGPKSAIVPLAEPRSGPKSRTGSSKEFEEFCKALSIEHLTTAIYHPRSNGLAERFVDTFKRALKKNQDMDTDEKSLENFLSVYRITPNPNTNSGLSPAELMFARKIRSVFDRILPNTTKTTATR